MTVGSRHTVDAEELAAALAALAPAPTPAASAPSTVQAANTSALVFVVPPRVYEKMKRQKLKISGASSRNLKRKREPGGAEGGAQPLSEPQLEALGKLYIPETFFFLKNAKHGIENVSMPFTGNCPPHARRTELSPRPLIGFLE